MEIKKSLKNKIRKDVLEKIENEEFDQKIQKVMVKEINHYTDAEAFYRQIHERKK
ncbi:hypothetical protein [Caldanaerobacter subterraneus]|uniref:Periplasmic protein kinase ArgK n=1 Tax=Caldanaerobacter subterraneus subsp. pacificus DSM 12653 TaxID=391606 RepID=A0A0F5PK00_9THEO|nr:hypothetical protein [Caldanaerobacter subterraneus]KKC28983.1 periplasmic protein kinase ArgK [Caldanaerobacter subterraneus subsp. pacificus DSM 12653]